MNLIRLQDKNEWNSLEFLYINNEKSGREIKITLLFTTATKRVKYLRINLPEEVKEYSKSYKIPMKKI